jgi:L-amino acid N-acyltransferase YncA
MITIRLAQKKDAESILAIYRPFIENTPVSFEESVPTVEQFWERIQKTLQDYPWLVCEINRDIAGYSYATSHRQRASYRWTKEVSVYVHLDYKRRGIGFGLYTALIELLKLQGVKNILAGITLPNKGNVAFHEKFGFTRIGVYKAVGFKLGRWHDVGWWELKVDDPNNKPDKRLKKLDEIVNSEGWKVAIEKAMGKIKPTL